MVGEGLPRSHRSGEGDEMKRERQRPEDAAQARIDAHIANPTDTHDVDPFTLRCAACGASREGLERFGWAQCPGGAASRDVPA